MNLEDSMTVRINTTEAKATRDRRVREFQKTKWVWILFGVGAAGMVILFLVMR